MTVYTSNLPNDADMNKALGSFACPLPLTVCDCIFSGVGSNDQSILVGIERKKVGDLAQCILNGRYIFQMQQAKSSGIDVLVLIAELGDIRSSPEDGLLEVLNWGISPRTFKRCQVWEPVKPTITYSRLDQYLTELDYLAGVMVKRSRDVHETAAIIKSLWDNFQTPPDQHNSLHAIFKAPLNEVLLVPPGLVRRVASELPGIGWGRSRAVADRFQTVWEMCQAGVEDWCQIEGIGKKTAEKVVASLGNDTQHPNQKQNSKRRK